MPVDTAKVEGRRILKFNSLDDILAELERLDHAKRRALGIRSFGTAGFDNFTVS